MKKDPSLMPSFLRDVPRWAKLTAQLLVVAVIFYFLGRSLDFAELKSLVLGVRPGWMAAAFGLVLVGRLVEASRWRLLLVDGGLRISTRRLLKPIFISMFLGQFLPGMVGPDVVRGYWLASRRGKLDVVATSLLSARMLGVYAMLVVGLAGAATARAQGHPTDLLSPILALCLVAAIGWPIAIKAIGGMRDRDLFRETRFADYWERAVRGAYRIVRVAEKSSTLLKVMGLSVGLIVLRCSIFYCLYRAVGVSVPMDLLMVFVPTMFIITLVPITVGGLGLREASLAYLFGTVGVAAEASVGVGLGFHLLQVLASLPGAPLWLGERRRGSYVQASADAPRPEGRASVSASE